MDISEVCYIIQILNSYNLLTDKKWPKIDLSNLQTKLKKLKKYWKIWIELSINYQFPSISEKILGIYWLDWHNLLTSKNSFKSRKQLKIIFLYMSVLNTLKYKQCLCIFTLQNVMHNLQTKSVQFTDQKISLRCKHYESSFP